MYNTINVQYIYTVSKKSFRSFIQIAGGVEGTGGTLEPPETRPPILLQK